MDIAPHIEIEITPPLQEIPLQFWAGTEWDTYYTDDVTRNHLCPGDMIHRLMSGKAVFLPGRINAVGQRYMAVKVRMHVTTPVVHMTLIDRALAKWRQYRLNR